MSGSASRSIPIIAPAEGVSEALIRRLVHTFYGRVLEDPDLGPIFTAALSHRWDEHLDTMVDFWSSVVLRTGRYTGKPHVAHVDLALTPALFVDRAHRIAESLQIGLGIGPKALDLP